MFIYKTTNTVNGKQYVGLCGREKADSYLGSGTLLRLAIKKYGKDKFEREIIERCESYEELLVREEYWIGQYNAVNDPMFYNLSHGGFAGNAEIVKEYWSTMTEEQRKTARNWKGHFIGLDQSGDKHISKLKDDWCDNVAKGVQETWDSYSDEERAKRADKVKQGIKENRRDFSGKNNPMAGRSAITEKNLKWYTDGINSLYVTEDTQPSGYYRGRKMKKRKVNEIV
jgi:hypothetical protein